jgi:hypothetical protein
MLATSPVVVSVIVVFVTVDEDDARAGVDVADGRQRSE